MNANLHNKMDNMKFTVDLPGIAGLLLAFLALWKTYRMMPIQEKMSDADVAAKYQAIADRSASQALELDRKIAALQVQVNAQDGIIANLRCENEDLRDWAERLVHQVQSLGQIPVTIRARKMESEE